jgi:FkbH-like protein
MLAYPLDFPHLLRKRRGLARELAEQQNLTPVKVAILGGSTTQEVGSWIELFLLDRGLRAETYHCDYNRYYEDTVLDASALATFAPDVVYLHLSTINLPLITSPMATEEEFEAAIKNRVEHFTAVWNAIWAAAPTAQIIMNTFEPPIFRPQGHLEAWSFAGGAHFVARLNQELAKAARQHSKLVLHDAASLAVTSGLANWYAPDRWYSYKIPTSAEADVVLGHSLAALIGAMFGKTRKCLILDLDNTLWGGVIGDDGPDKIVIGRETARAEAYTAFQEYCKRLQQRGVLLAVCSKNDDAMARRGFAHPDSVLKLEDFAAFKANWEPKWENIKAIATELNLGLDSFVFVDDNPAERHLVGGQLPMVAVPNVGDDITRYAAILDSARYFEAVSFSAEDAQRTKLYAQKAEAESAAQSFADYGEYLDSLEMVAEIDAFNATYLDRITQLTNKTNQFNLTTRRYTKAEMEEVAADPKFITLYGRLSDKFGDNGLVTVVIGRKDARVLHVDLWLMSCRVLKRGMEDAMLDALVARAKDAGIETIVGTYIATPRNSMVAGFYDQMGFQRHPESTDERATYSLDLTQGYTQRNLHIQEPTSARHS